jgi:2-oxoisovalerate dehydrogenase E2 component (dihydrolipoyl transacylase)
VSLYEMKLPDVGEGVAEAEIVEWLVEVGDEVTPDTVLAEVLTDKATVEVSPPVTGTVVARYGEPGDVLAVGTILIGIETADGVTPEQEAGIPAEPEPEAGSAPEAAPEPEAGPEPTSEPEPEPAFEPPSTAEPTAAAGRKRTARVMAAPAVRRRADELGIDLTGVPGSGPEGRIVHADLDRLLLRGPGSPARPSGRTTERANEGARVEPVRGVRRRIAERLSATWSEIPHITYVEAVDVTELEALRAELNAPDDGRMRLTMLPFIVRAVAVACRDQPEINAHYDHASETLTVHAAVHVGIATQTDQGLLVPVLRHADRLGLRDAAAEIARLADAARNASASRDELSGSTITITSLGAVGGVATTPILNAPEVAIIGVNKMEVRPVWRDGAFQPRRMVNLSSSFDHRMVDGWEAARFVQRLKSLLETPALLFVD